MLEPGPTSPGCYRYTVTVSEDTVSVPAEGDPLQEIEIAVRILEDLCHTGPDDLDSVHVDLYPRFSGPAEHPIGIPFSCA